MNSDKKVGDKMKKAPHFYGLIKSNDDGIAITGKTKLNNDYNYAMFKHVSLNCPRLSYIRTACGGIFHFVYRTRTAVVAAARKNANMKT